MDPKAEIRRAVRVAGFGGLTLGMLGAYRAHDRLTRDDDRPALRERYVKAWSDGMLRMFGVHVLVTGAPIPQGPHLVVANHRSTIDIGVVLSVVGGHIVSRDDLAKWPLVGTAARTVGTVFVDRENASSGVTAIRAMSRLLTEGKKVTVFPEGTTFAGDEVRPFHKGAFVAAKMASCPILPVGIAYGGSSASFVNETFLAHLSRMAKTPSTRVAVAIGEPMAIEKNAERAASAARERVADLVAKARALVDA